MSTKFSHNALEMKIMQQNKKKKSVPAFIHCTSMIYLNHYFPTNKHSFHSPPYFSLKRLCFLQMKIVTIKLNDDRGENGLHFILK
jgi:hypothetical protein